MNGLVYAASQASLLSESWVKIREVLIVVAGFFGIVLVVFFVAGRVRGKFGTRVSQAVFLGPAVALVTIGILYPTIRTAAMSFMDEFGREFVGLKNYKWAFGPQELPVIMTTLLWLIIPAFTSTAIGLIVAVMVDRMRGQAIWKAMIFMPTAISFVGASIIWKFVYEYKGPEYNQVGLLSQLVMWLGVKNPPHWLMVPNLNNILLIVIMIWIQTGFAVVVLSAAIKAVPTEIIEAGRMDGATGMKLFTRVQIPMIRSSLIVVLTTIMTGTLKTFDIVRTMTGGNFGTNIVPNDMYQQAFVAMNMGRGSALAVLLLAGVIPMMAYNVHQLRKERAIR